MPISNTFREYFNTGDLKIITVKDSKHATVMCVVLRSLSRDIKSSSILVWRYETEGERRPWHQSHFASHASVLPVTQLFTKQFQVLMRSDEKRSCSVSSRGIKHLNFCPKLQ